MIGMRAWSLPNCDNVRVRRNRHVFQNPRTDPPTQKVALDSTTSTTRCSTAYVHPATSDDVFSLAGRMPSTHFPARPGPDNPTRGIARTRFAPGNERRLLAVEPSTARPNPALPSPPRSEDFCLGDLLYFSSCH
jgi:hypothetical protein